jgi:small-conductance mechanosensitive channel
LPGSPRSGLKRRDVDSIGWNWRTTYAWINTPLFTVGETPITVSTIAILCAILFFAWWFSYMLEKGLRGMALRGRGGTTSSTVYAFARILRYVVWIAGSLIGLTYLGFDLTTFALIGGAIGLGIGFGLQSIVANFISGIVLLVEKTLKVGDFVDLESGVRGTVTEIGMRFTRVTTNDSVDVLVPNSEFINQRVTNWTYRERNRRIRVPFTVAYGSDKRQLREAALAAAQKVKGLIIDALHPVDLWLVRLGDNGLQFELLVWVGPDLIARPGRTQSELLWALEDELGRRGIVIPFPQRDLHVRTGSAPSQMAAGEPRRSESTGMSQQQ